MSNSPLVNYTRISPNQYGKRNHVIDTITIHCIVGQLEPEVIGSIFADPKRQASSNYSVGPTGRIGMFVQEGNAPWTSSSYSNDQRAVTIETACDLSSPYKVNSKAYKALIKLVSDICKRNGIKKLVWSNNRSDRVNHANGCNMTLHRDFASTDCPGQWLIDHMGDIAKKVNAKLVSSVKLKSNGILYQYDYKDPLGHSSKALKNFKKGTKVKLIKDDGWGWSKIKAGDLTGWIINGHLKNSSLSKFKTLKLDDDVSAILIENGKKKKIVTLRKGKKYKFYCTITHGDYAGKSYIGIGKKRYYI